MLKGGLPTATAYYKKHKISKGETIAQSLKEVSALAVTLPRIEMYPVFFVA